MNRPSRIFDILLNFEKHPEIYKNFVLAEKIDNNWRTYNSKEYKEISFKIASGLIELGVKRGTKIATITTNRPQWNFLDMAILLAGGVHVTVYPTISDEEFKYILAHSDAEYVFVVNKSLATKIKSLSKDIAAIKNIFTFDKVEEFDHYSELIKLGTINYEKNLPVIIKNISEIDENEPASIIYTSGTTGIPKGVVLSHKNILFVSWQSSKIMNLNHTHRVLDFLPLSHIFAHMTNYIYQILGISIYYVDNVAKVADYIHELKIDGFITVPRLLEAIFEKIQLKAQKLSKIKQFIFGLSLKVAKRYNPYNNSFIYKIVHKIFDILVYKQWRKALSPNVRFLGCGGSALNPTLNRIFWAAGFRVFEGYGLTETSPIIAVNYDEKNKIKIGTVGTILNGVEVKIAEDGEILVKGPNVMLGYYKNPEATAEVFTDDGYFKTGDIGFIDNEGFLHITDRKKEIFKLSTGKYVAPQKLENKLKESFLIKQAVVVGENMNFPVALISPNIDFFEAWAEKEKIKIDVENPDKCIRIIEKLKLEIEKINKKLAEHEKIRKFIVLKKELTVASGELSNTLKFKRKVIVEKYKHLLDEVYHRNR